MITIDRVISLEENMTEKNFESDFSLLDSDLDLTFAEEDSDLDLDLEPMDSVLALDLGPLDLDSDLNYLGLTTSLPVSLRDNYLSKIRRHRKRCSI
jgi:hypothetical protein